MRNRYKIRLCKCGPDFRAFRTKCGRTRCCRLQVRPGRKSDRSRWLQVIGFYLLPARPRWRRYADRWCRRCEVMPRSVLSLEYVRSDTRSLQSNVRQPSEKEMSGNSRTPRRLAYERMARAFFFGTFPILGSPRMTNSQARMAASSKSGSDAGSTCQPVTSLSNNAMERIIGNSRRRLS